MSSIGKGSSCFIERSRTVIFSALACLSVVMIQQNIQLTSRTLSSTGGGGAVLYFALKRTFYIRSFKHLPSPHLILIYRHCLTLCELVANGLTPFRKHAPLSSMQATHKLTKFDHTLPHPNKTMAPAQNLSEGLWLRTLQLVQ